MLPFSTRFDATAARYVTILSGLTSSSLAEMLKESVGPRLLNPTPRGCAIVSLVFCSGPHVMPFAASDLLVVVVNINAMGCYGELFVAAALLRPIRETLSGATALGGIAHGLRPSAPPARHAASTNEIS